MDRYTKRFLIVIMLMLAVIAAISTLMDIAPLHSLLMLLGGYVSAIASPARLFAESEGRMPAIGELARYPLIWAAIFALALGVLMALLGASGVFGLVLIILAFAAAIGAATFPLFVRIYLARAK